MVKFKSSINHKFMPFIEWKNEYALGINEIDVQHQKMLAIIDKLYNIFDQKKYENQEELNKIIQELTDYAVYHFQTEEHYFDLFGYQDKTAHVQIHNQYREKIEAWRQRYNETKDKAVFFEISNFLHDWWIWHINNTDRDYVPFLTANGVK